MGNKRAKPKQRGDEPVKRIPIVPSDQRGSPLEEPTDESIPFPSEVELTPAHLVIIKILAKRAVADYLQSRRWELEAEAESRNLCLSRTEIQALTRSPRKASQVRFLVRNGIRHYIDGYGWPVVTRAAVEGERAPSPKVEWQPSKARS